MASESLVAGRASSWFELNELGMDPPSCLRPRAAETPASEPGLARTALPGNRQRVDRLDLPGSVTVMTRG